MNDTTNAMDDIDHPSLMAIFQNSPVGFGVSRNRRLTLVSDYLCTLLGYDRDELLGKNARILYTSDEEFDRVGRSQAKIADTYGEVETRWRRKDGQLLDILLRFVPMDPADGKKGISFTAIDVTLRAKAETSMRESEFKYRSLFEVSPHAVILVHFETSSIIEANDRFCELYGLPADRIIGNTPVELGLYSESDRNRFLQTLLTEQSVDGFEMEFHARGGERFKTLMFSKLIRLGDDAYILTFYHDITHQKELEQRFHQAQKLEAIGTLAGGIAHDFNNLLMGIQGNAALLRTVLEMEHPEITKRLDKIDQHIQSGADLTRQLLGFARGGRYEAAQTDLNEVVRKTTTMFSRTRKELRIRTQFQKGLWGATVDQRQIEHVLIDLYVNAWQAMPDGGELTVTTANSTLDEAFVEPYAIIAGNYIQISVADSGIGMDEATLERIFDPFFTTKEIQRGTGLGLASAYGVIQNHGGAIVADSQPNVGTTVHLYLPSTDQEAGKKPSRAMNDIVLGQESILLVDDESMILDVTQSMLETMGYNVLTADSGQAAIDLCSRVDTDIDLVILDMIMPDMGGDACFEKLKDCRPQLRILLSSGYSINGKAEDILKKGCDGFIQKPFNMSALSSKIRTILDSPAPADSH